jgi:hypothetical protein
MGSNGDLLSPLLFVLTMEALNAWYKFVDTQSLFKGIRVSYNRTALDGRDQDFVEWAAIV